MLKLNYMMEVTEESNAMKMSHSLFFLHLLIACLTPTGTVGQVQLPNTYFPIPTYCLSMRPLFLY